MNVDTADVSDELVRSKLKLALSIHNFQVLLLWTDLECQQRHMIHCSTNVVHIKYQKYLTLPT